MDWKCVVRYIPSTDGKPGGFGEVGSVEFFAAKGERITVENTWTSGPFMDPVRHGLRPVGTKDSEGENR
jgi:hypothetical protein